MLHSHLHARPRLVSNAKLLRVDPTRTTGIVRRFVADIRRRVKKLAAAVTVFLDAEDELGLKDHTTLIRMARTFAYRTDADKLKAFNEWFAQQIRAKVLSVPLGTDPSRPWTAEYVEAAYKRGLLNAYFSAKEVRLLEDSQQNEHNFMRALLTSAAVIALLRLLASRSFEELRGVTAQMSVSMSRILANGLAEGRTPLAIASTMRQNLASLTAKRAELIPKTEVIRSHAAGQLDAFAKLGIRELGLKVEWRTMQDERVCPQCETLEGEIFTIDEAGGLIPFHPNCRCSWISVTVPGY